MKNHYNSNCNFLLVIITIDDDFTCEYSSVHLKRKQGTNKKETLQAEPRGLRDRKKNIGSNFF